MHPAEIKAALEIQGYSQSAIADECGVQRSTVNMVVNGKGRSQKVEERIATVLRKSLGEIWPHWYDIEPRYAHVRDEGSLSADELALLAIYRRLTNAQRDQARGMLELLAKTGAHASRSVHADRGSVAAGRDVNIGPASRRRK